MSTKKLGEMSSVELIEAIKELNCDTYGVELLLASKEQLLMILYFNGYTSAKITPDVLLNKIAEKVVERLDSHYCDERDDTVLCNGVCSDCCCHR